MYYVGENVRMFCSSHDENSFLWTVNGSVHTEFTTITTTNLNTISLLTWESITKAYNNSVIRCGVQTEASYIWSNEIVIRLQGE